MSLKVSVKLRSIQTVQMYLAEFTTRVEADKKYPVLLANGNLLETGEVGENRHFAIWQDPTKKPSYLFACVIGDLAVLKDRYTTSEGRDVANS
jgi:aminopeptidase N